MDRFKAVPSKQAWYYHEVAAIVRLRLGADHILAQELTAAEEEFRRTLLEATEVEGHEMNSEAVAITGLGGSLPQK